MVAECIDPTFRIKTKKKRYMNMDIHMKKIQYKANLWFDKEKTYTPGFDGICPGPLLETATCIPI